MSVIIRRYTDHMKFCCFFILLRLWCVSLCIWLYVLYASVSLCIPLDLKLKERSQPPNTQQSDLTPKRVLSPPTLRILFLYSEPLLTGHPPSYWFRLFSSQTFSYINTPTSLKSIHTSYLPSYEDETVFRNVGL